MNARKIISLLICITLMVVTVLPSFAAESTPTFHDTTVYVSSAGNDENDGTQDAPFKTLERAWTNNLKVNYTIVLLDDIAIQSSSFSFDSANMGSYIFIKGATPDVVLDLSAKKQMGLYCQGIVTFDNITLNFADKTRFYAVGRSLTITDTVTFTNRINLYGGGAAASTRKTDLTINGGKYYVICGGSYNGNVYGDVNLSIGGNVNISDGIDPSDTTTVSPCYVYGGGYNGEVTGDINITFGGQARARYLYGSGEKNTDLVKGKINIDITGGKITDVYGSRFATGDANVNISINVTGGVVGNVFGGANSASINGNTSVYVGPNANISCSVYGGCYNPTDGSSANKVTGGTTVIIDNGCQISSGIDIKTSNTTDKGIHAGSRLTSNSAEEVSVLAFVNGGYSAYSGKIGGTFGSMHDYIVQAKTGGTVKSSIALGTVILVPNENKAALIDSALYANGFVYSLTKATTIVEFTENYNSVVYDYNNGTGKTFEVAKAPNGSITIIKSTESNGDLRFIGWATTADATEPDYLVGSKYSSNADLTLYAVWRVNDTEYSVMHIVETYNGTTIYKNETKPGVIGTLTEAEAFDLLGYTLSSPVLQETLSEEMYTVIPVNYVMGEGTVKDVNLDGRVNLRDAALLRRFIAEWEGYDGSKVCYFTSDINGDNTVNLTDAVQLQRYLAGWENLAG